MTANLKYISLPRKAGFNYPLTNQTSVHNLNYNPTIEALFQKASETLKEMHKPKKIKTYSSTRTRSERWRAGSKSSRPKHNWSKKKRQRWLP